MKQIKCVKKEGDDDLRMACSTKTSNKKSIKIFLLIFYLSLFSVGTIFAQELTVKGSVFDEENEPLIGASVTVKNGKTGTVTSLDGSFTLQVPNADVTLEISYLGFLPKLIKASDVNALSHIVLESDAQQLGEVVITGMTQIDKRLFTGATDRIKAEDVKLGGLADISRSLEGRSAGVTVQNISGTFGTAPKIRVRGATSIYGDSKPLWVVDGVIVEEISSVAADDLSSGDISTLISSAIAGLNTDDISDVQILKDGSATSIYGAKAMAGVIVVTTKKGTANSAAIRYTGELTTRLIPSYGDINIMNSQEQMSVYQEMEQKGWLNYSDGYNAKNSGVYGRLYRLINTYDSNTETFAIPHAEATRNAYLREAERRNTDWFSELFTLTPMQNHSVSLSGGTGKSTYYASLSAMLDPGWMKSSGVKRYTVNINMDHKIYKNLTLNLNAKAFTRNQKAPGTMQRSMDVVYGEVFRNFDINPYYYAANTSRTMDPDEFYIRDYAPFNIKHELDNNYMDLNEANATIKAELKWTPIKGLDIKLLGNYKYSGASMEHHVYDNSNQALAYRTMKTSVIANNNPYLWRDPTKPYSLPISILPEGGFYERTDNRMSGYDWRVSANYATGFGPDHVVTFFGGTEFNAVDRLEAWTRDWGRQYELGNKPFTVYQAWQRWQERGENYYSIKNRRRRDEAFFAQASYSYKGKYAVNFTGRYEGSNQMGKSHQSRWLPTWNIGGLWNLSDEAFARLLNPILSHTSIRTSYSLTASPPPTRYSTAVIFSSENTWRVNSNTNEPALHISDIGNQWLTYEKKKEFNLGVDLGFINNRINLTLDGYTRHNFGLIGATVTEGSGGQIDKEGNIAEMKSKGIDATLTTRNITGKDFKWTTNFTFAVFDTKVTKLGTHERIIDLITGNGFAMEGYSHRMLFSIPFAGLNEDGIPLVYNNDGDKVKYIDFQERDLADMKFLVPSGRTEPNFTGGLGNNFRYKDLSLNVFFTYSFGNVKRLDPFFSVSYSDLTAMPKELKNRWVIPGDENYTTVPAIASYRQYKTESYNRYAYNAYNYSTERVADGGFIRLKDISLAYNLPAKLISPIGIKDLSVKLQATNLLLLYADKKLNGQDPEFYNSGGVATPVPRQITFTLSLGL
jgi:TonB-linked SusC/RagA family outer membrane protein